MLGTQLSAEEREKASHFDFAALGRAGAAKRHAPMAALRTWTIEQYQRGKWRSANQAAHDLKCRVIEHGRSIGAYLTEANAQRTIYDWIRKHA